MALKLILVLKCFKRVIQGLETLGKFIIRPEMSINVQKGPEGLE